MKVATSLGLLTRASVARSLQVPADMRLTRALSRAKIPMRTCYLHWLPAPKHPSCSNHRLFLHPLLTGTMKLERGRPARSGRTQAGSGGPASSFRLTVQ